MPLLEPHISEESLEAYAMGKLPADLAESVEEHLLHCETCRDDLQEHDDFIRAIRVAIQTEKSSSPPARRVGLKSFFSSLAEIPLNRPLPFAASLAGLGLALVLIAPRQLPVQGTAAVRLTAMRGDAASVMGDAPAYHRLRLDLDATALPPAEYRLELVSGVGAVLWSAAAAVEGERLRALTPVSLAPGSYWIRVLRTRDGAMVREFGLKVK